MWRWTKQQARILWRYLKGPLRRTATFLFVGVIIAGAWYAFLAIVAPPPIATTPALIMVWASVVILLFPLFPQVLDRVKKIKVKDFELELQDAVAKAATKDFITLSDFDDHIFSTKDDFRNLGEILERAARFPGKPVLLVANLRDGRYVSIPMLFIYLFFLELIGSSVTILFISTRPSIQTFDDIRQDCIIGAVSGNKVIQKFLEQFSSLYRIFDYRDLNDNISFGEFFRSGEFSDTSHENFFSRLRNQVGDISENRDDYLREEDVKSWFSAELSTYAVDVSISESDISSIREAIAEDDEFILVFKNNRLNSVVSICVITRDISRKTLQEAE